MILKNLLIATVLTLLFFTGCSGSKYAPGVYEAGKNAESDCYASGGCWNGNQCGPCR